MIYRFQSKASGDVLMNAAVGDRMLEILGRPPAEKGIVEAAALPAAIAALEQAVATSVAAEDGGDGGKDAALDRERERRVGLAQRAYPLLQLLKRSHAAGADVVWGV